MQAIRRTAQRALAQAGAAAAHSARARPAARCLATHATPTPLDTAAPLPGNRFVVVPSSPSTSADGAAAKPASRYSKHSSRTQGRTPRRVRKATSPTELKADGALGEYEHATAGELRIFLPSVFMRLVRNTGEHRDDPYTATFRTSLQLTKPDITNYLKNIYGLHVTSIRTINYLSALKRNPIGGGYGRSGGTKSYKKVLVTMTEPFWYPEERTRGWLNEHFERDRMEEMRDRKMLKIGDGHKYGVSSSRYRGAHKSKAERERLRAVSKAGGNDVDAREPGEQVALRRPAGLRKKRNVLRSREERVVEERELVEQEMQRLREAGW
ncbi:mitochondrial 54S ribosomal protein uL23m MRP20 [Rhodotorula paludigena]|uniref:mitochondrial 54S ribosomal protein uL23m MRP20 n=1 Tax=Rhodotorula paludigena TaxID=86838 RepID=UPI0031794E78